MAILPLLRRRQTHHSVMCFWTARSLRGRMLSRAFIWGGRGARLRQRLLSGASCRQSSARKGGTIGGMSPTRPPPVMRNTAARDQGHQSLVGCLGPDNWATAMRLPSRSRIFFGGVTGGCRFFGTNHREQSSSLDRTRIAQKVARTCSCRHLMAGRWRRRLPGAAGAVRQFGEPHRQALAGSRQRGGQKGVLCAAHLSNQTPMHMAGVDVCRRGVARNRDPLRVS